MSNRDMWMGTKDHQSGEDLRMHRRRLAVALKRSDALLPVDQMQDKIAAIKNELQTPQGEGRA